MVNQLYGVKLNVVKMYTVIVLKIGGNKMIPVAIAELNGKQIHYFFFFFAFFLFLFLVFLVFFGSILGTALNIWNY